MMARCATRYDNEFILTIHPNTQLALNISHIDFTVMSCFELIKICDDLKQCEIELQNDEYVCESDVIKQNVPAWSEFGVVLSLTRISATDFNVKVIHVSSENPLRFQMF